VWVVIESVFFFLLLWGCCKGEGEGGGGGGGGGGNTTQIQCISTSAGLNLGRVFLYLGVGSMLKCIDICQCSHVCTNVCVYLGCEGEEFNFELCINLGCMYVCVYIRAYERTVCIYTPSV